LTCKGPWCNPSGAEVRLLPVVSCDPLQRGAPRLLPGNSLKQLPVPLPWHHRAACPARSGSAWSFSSKFWARFTSRVGHRWADTLSGTWSPVPTGTSNSDAQGLASGAWRHWAKVIRGSTSMPHPRALLSHFEVFMLLRCTLSFQSLIWRFVGSRFWTAPPNCSRPLGTGSDHGTEERTHVELPRNAALHKCKRSNAELRWAKSPSAFRTALRIVSSPRGIVVDFGRSRYRHWTRAGRMAPTTPGHENFTAHVAIFCFFLYGYGSTRQIYWSLPCRTVTGQNHRPRCIERWGKDRKISNSVV